jgi:hypothetical protein
LNNHNLGFKKAAGPLNTSFCSDVSFGSPFKEKRLANEVMGGISQSKMKFEGNTDNPETEKTLRIKFQHTDWSYETSSCKSE